MDKNGQIASLLRDFAAIQKSKQSMWGYKRAASAMLALDEPITSFLKADGTLRKIPNIGPSSTRIILEVLRTRLRHADGRQKSPSAAVVDTQTVRTANGGVKGYDAGKRTPGRKRHIIVETMGLLLAQLAKDSGATSVEIIDTNASYIAASSAVSEAVLHVPEATNGEGSE